MVEQASMMVEQASIKQHLTELRPAKTYVGEFARLRGFAHFY
jgi:hypothetical protein